MTKTPQQTAKFNKAVIRLANAIWQMRDLANESAELIGEIRGSEIMDAALIRALTMNCVAMGKEDAAESLADEDLDECLNDMGQDIACQEIQERDFQSEIFAVIGDMYRDDSSPPLG
jgi:hypothetical protein